MKSASLIANPTFDEHRTTSHKLRFALAYGLIALAFVSTAPSAHAAVGARWAYILDPAGFVNQYTANRANGSLLINKACVVQPAGAKPTSVKIDPSRNYVYVADMVGNQIFEFVINQVNGCIAPNAPPVIPTAGTNPTSVHITGDGKYLYVSDIFAGNAAVEGFSITPGTGVLVPLGPPLNYGLAQSDLAYDPVEDLLLAADNSAPAGPVTTFTVVAGGGLAIDAVSPVNANPFAMNVDAVNGFLFVLSGGAGANVDSYTINLATGALVHNNAQPTGVGPHSVVSTSIGQLAYVTNFGAGTVSSYSILPGGKLLKFGGLDTPLRAPALNPARAAIEASGTFLYTLDGSGHVSIFRITAGKAVEQPLAVSPFALTYLNPSGIAITN